MLHPSASPANSLEASPQLGRATWHIPSVTGPYQRVGGGGERKRAGVHVLAWGTVIKWGGGGGGGGGKEAPTHWPSGKLARKSSSGTASTSTRGVTLDA